jgi:uncharacterized protein (UPF0333 family)
MKRAKKGQSILEYLIIVAVIVAAITAASALFSTNTRTMVTTAGGKVESSVNAALGN